MTRVIRGGPRGTLRAGLCLLLAAVGCGPESSPSAEPSAELSRERPTSAERVQLATGREAMVVAGHPDPVRLGVETLRRGGTAMDAAVTVSFALGVAEPYGSGLGGKAMLLYFDAASGETFVVDGMDEASNALDVDAFRARPREERVVGWGAVAVPGLVAAAHEGHRRWGRLPWGDVVMPVAELARSGAEVQPGAAKFFEHRLDRIRSSAEAQRIYLPGGEIPPVGGRMVNTDLAETLAAIAERGADGFYRGWVAEAIAGASVAGGGSLRLEDLHAYRPRVGKPLETEFGELRVLSAPPPATGGVTVLAVLARLQSAVWPSKNLSSPLSLDLLARTLQPLYPEIQARIADVPEALRASEELLVRESVPALTAPPGPGQAGTHAPASPTSSTTHFVVADRFGNVVSMTQSLSHHFGAGVVAPGTGVLFNNSLKNFTFDDPASVNAPAPGKRPRSTIAPTLLLEGERAVGALGIPGGQRIPTATIQVLLDSLVFGTELPVSIARPRVHLRRPLQKDQPDNVFEFEFADEGVSQPLAELGWAVEISENPEVFGGFCALVKDDEGGWLGIADLRRTNAAMGF